MKQQSTEVTFTITLEEANKVFKALGNLPFTEVYVLIGKLNEQANSQLSENKETSRSFIHEASMHIDQSINN